MDRIRIIGGAPLIGTIPISGAKNAALPLMAASLLSAGDLILDNLPRLADVKTLSDLLTSIGISVSITDTGHTTRGVFSGNTHLMSEAPYELVRKMRASILVLGPLVARTGYAKVSLPGGCALGARAVDLHIKGLEKMGATITLDDGYIIAKAPSMGLKGADFTFPIITVTGTENLLMAATLANGTTRLMNAAIEPEVTDLANCLVAMGAKIDGIGTHTLIVHGVCALHGATHRVLPDRIETGTYAMAAAITGGDVTLTGTRLDLLQTAKDAMESAGVIFTEIPDGFTVKRGGNRLNAVDVTTEPYPGFATDLQAQFMTLMTLANGASALTETIFENRFMHVPELSRMGADITVKGRTAIVRGVSALKGAPVMATDLRASVSLVLAGLAAAGETIVHRVYHLDRGYAMLEQKLKACGASIERLRGEDTHHDHPSLSIA